MWFCLMVFRFIRFPVQLPLPRAKVFDMGDNRPVAKDPSLFAA